MTAESKEEGECEIEIRTMNAWIEWAELTVLEFRKIKIYQNFITYLYYTAIYLSISTNLPFYYLFISIHPSIHPTIREMVTTLGHIRSTL